MLQGYGGHCNYSNKMEEVADLVLGKVTQEMNEQLTKKFQKEEIIQVVQNMHPKKP